MDSLRDQLQAALGDAYTLERELGGGGMSRVFVARETALSRTVVVKVLAPELAAGVSADRFQREIRLAAALQHPNIVPVHAAGATGGLPYYTMPFVEGLSLRARIERGVPLSIPDVVSICKDVARALTYAHEQGVVHRDIKPENILIAGDAAVVTDFGIAKAVQASRSESSSGTLTQTGTSVGTPAYMAPEQAAGDPATDHRADLYAFGCVAYELLAGAPVFAGKRPHQLLLAHATEAPMAVETRRPDCPAGLSSLVSRCLEKDPLHRPQSAREILQALDNAASAGSGGAIVRPPRRVALVAGAAVVLVAAVAAVAAVVVSNARGGDTTIDRSIAVLPFENAGGDTSNAYFAEGIAEELITALSNVPGLRVAGRASSFRYRDRTRSVGEVAKALNVASLVNGSVRRLGPRMRVTAELTSATNDSVLWSQSYERDITDAFTVQAEITGAITSALRIRLAVAADSGATAPVVRQTDAEAYDAYLRGLALLRRRGRFVVEAIPYFEQAIARDSGFARAWAQLASALSSLPIMVREDVPDGATRAFAAARRAITLDSTSAEAHGALGAAYMYRAVDVRRAIPEFERALALDPNYANARSNLALSLSRVGQFDRAIAEAQRAVDSDPMAAGTYNLQARANMYGRRFTQAAEAARRALQLDSLQPAALGQWAIAEYFLGRPESARAMALRLSDAPLVAVHRAFLLAATGDAESHAELLRSLESQRGHPASGETAMAAAYLGMRDTTHALEALERATKRRETMFAIEFAHPMFDTIRGSARFNACLRAFGVDPAAVNQVVSRKAQ